MRPIKIKKINEKDIKPWDLNDYLYHLRETEIIPIIKW
jgi:hypothetical protein